MTHWKDPKKEKPEDGEMVLIRECYTHPSLGNPIANLNLFTYSSNNDFEYYATLSKSLLKRADYRITHWMRIPPVENE